MTRRAALISGGGSGIGLACSQTLSELGYGIALCGRDRRKLDLASQGVPNAITLVCDVTSRSSVVAAVRQAVHQFGGLDVVVASAGIFPSRAAIDRIPLKEWDAVLATNLTGVFNTLSVALPQLRSRRGYAFAIGSIYSHHGLRLGGAYAASKWGLLGLMQTLLQEFEEHGVRGTTILPGVVDTPMVDQAEKRELLLSADDIARTIQWCLELSANVIVREVALKRALVARCDPEIQESAPSWHRD